MENQIEEFANDIHKATRRASAILVEETTAFVKANHHYHSKDDYDKVHPKTLAELEAEYLTKQGYRKVEQGEWKQQNDGTHYCSICGNDATRNYEGVEICGVACAYCGSNMKGN